MKRTFAYFASAVMLVVFYGAMSGIAPAASENDSGKEALVKEVYEFIKGCGNYYLATMEGDQPRVRPFGSLAIFEGKIYFQTGKVKNVSKQISGNPKIEICAYDDNGKWIRVQAVAVEDERREAKQFLLDAHPELKSMYSADDDNTQVLYLKEVSARFYSFTNAGEPKLIEF
jgi:uncharacterized pyridoxamine 5'-phosphate oxidase family protein